MNEEEPRMIIYAGFDTWTGDPPGEDLELLEWDEEKMKKWVAEDPYKSEGNYTQHGRRYCAWKIGVEGGGGDDNE